MDKRKFLTSLCPNLYRLCWLALTYSLSLADSDNFDQFFVSQSVTPESNLINQSTWLFLVLLCSSEFVCTLMYTSHVLWCNLLLDWFESAGQTFWIWYQEWQIGSRINGGH
jgi:hypothetical protein